MDDIEHLIIRKYAHVRIHVIMSVMFLSEFS